MDWCVGRPLTCIVFVLVTFLQGLLTHEWGTEKSVESCDYETFEGRCSRDEIIVVLSAEYGHLSLGRCIQADLGFFGCQADVTDVVDSRCTGLQRCQLAVSDQAIRRTRPCISGISHHLKVTYVCVQAFRSLCQPLRADASQKYVSSTQMFKDPCSIGPSAVVEASPGQRINLTLLSLTSSSGTYGLASGNDEDIPIVSHGNGSARVGVLRSHRVDIVLDPQFRNSKFLIGFKATGCSDISLPQNTIFERTSENGDRATVSCKESQQTWQLSCRGVHWLGVIGNCSVPAEKASISVPEVAIKGQDREQRTFSLSKEVIYVVISSVTALAAVTIVMIGYYCVKRMNTQSFTMNNAAELVPVSVPVEYPQNNTDYALPQYPPAPTMTPDLPQYTIPEVPKPAPQTTHRPDTDGSYSNYPKKYYVLDKDFLNKRNDSVA